MWPSLVMLLIVGYGSLTRTFAYVGLAPLNLYIGEAALAAFLLARPHEGIGRWIRALVRPHALSGLSWALFGVVSYGAFQVARGIALGHPMVPTLRDFAFNYYPLYIFLGLWVGLRYPGTLRRTLRALAWCNGLYGLAFIVWLHRVRQELPWTPIPVDLFTQPGASAVSLLGLLAFERDIRRLVVWIPLVLNFVVLLTLQVRAEWLGLLAGLMTWMTLTGRIRRVLAVAIVGATLLAGAYGADIQIRTGRGVASPTEIIGRVLAPVDRELAGEFTNSAEVQAGTVLWRTRWWKAIWRSVHDDARTAWFGHGYGYALYGVASHVGDYVRTPHNWFLLLLGYGGWFGVASFALLQIALVRRLWPGTKPEAAFGLAYWVLAIVMGLFSNLFEAPFGAVPFYLLAGLALGEVHFAVRSSQEARVGVRARRANVEGRAVTPPTKSPVNRTTAL